MYLAITKKIAPLLWALAAATAISTARAADPSPPEIKALIAQLGARDAVDRDKAESRLVDMGLACRPALLEAMSSPDLEIKVRAARAIESLRTKSSRTDLLWNEQVSALPNVNLAAAKIGNRSFIYYSDGNAITAREVTPGVEPKNGPPLQLLGFRIGTLTVAGERLLVTTSDNCLIALDAVTLKTLWTCDAEKRAIAAAGADPAPPAAGFGRGAAANAPVAAAAVARGGRGPSLILAGMCRPTVDGDTAYLAGTANLYAIDLNTGKPIWSQPFTLGIIGSPAVNADRVFVSNSGPISNSGSVASFDRKTGQPLATFDNVDPFSAPLVTKDAVIVSKLEGLIALDVKDGHILWNHEDSNLRVELSPNSFTMPTRPAPGRISVGVNPPVLNNGTLYFATLESLFALDPATGQTRWKWRPTPPPVTDGAPLPPVISTSSILRTMSSLSALTFNGDHIVLTTSQGIFALNAKLGLPDWEFHPPNGSMQNTSVSSVYLQPVIADGTLEAHFTVRETRETLTIDGGKLIQTTTSNRLIGMKAEPASPQQGNP